MVRAVSFGVAGVVINLPLRAHEYGIIYLCKVLYFAVFDAVVCST
jgi:hypothetical protein